MTKEEIIAIYIEVSNKLCNGTEWCWAGVDEPLQLFAKLVAQAEREACAKLMDEMAVKDNLTNYYKVAANAIRGQE